MTARRTFGRVVLGSAVAVAALAELSLAVVGLSTRAGASGLFGHTVDVVRSGSMTPTFRTGDLVVDRSVTSAQARHLRVGQIISFTISYPPGGPTTFTHRIAAVTAEGYRTKGDANNAVDSWTVRPSAVRGVFERRVPDAGYVVAFVHTRDGLVILLLVPIVFFLASCLGRAWQGAGDGGPDGAHPAEDGAGTPAELSLQGASID